jgi:hypothetical protein
MSPRVILFYLLLAALVALTWWRGRSDERLAAAICVGGTAVTVLVGNGLHVSESDFHAAAFMVDALIFLLFLGIALRSERFWPMWVAGLQLTTASVHLLMIVSPDLPGLIFGTALAFWSYPILLLIAIGAWRTPLVERWRAAHDIASGKAIT